MSDNSPFQIRLELLKIARDIVSERVYAEQETVRVNWENGPRQGSQFPTLPSSSVEDVLKVADTLNAFVSKKE